MLGCPVAKMIVREGGAGVGEEKYERDGRLQLEVTRKVREEAELWVGREQTSTNKEYNKLG